MWKQTWMMADRLERVIVGLYMTRGDGLYFIIQECHQERGDTEGDRSIDKLLKSPRILKVESGPIRLSARLHISWWLCKFQVTNSQKLFTEIWDYWSGIGMSVLSARIMIMSMDNQKQVNYPASWWNEQMLLRCLWYQVMMAIYCIGSTLFENVVLWFEMWWDEGRPQLRIYRCLITLFCFLSYTLIAMLRIPLMLKLSIEYEYLIMKSPWVLNSNNFSQRKILWAHFRQLIAN